MENNVGFVIVDAPSDQHSLIEIVRNTLAQAREAGLRPLLYFYSDLSWDCKALRRSLDDPVLVESLRGTYMVRVSADAFRGRAREMGFGYDFAPALFRLDERGKAVARVDARSWKFQTTPENVARVLQSFLCDEARHESAAQGATANSLIDKAGDGLIARGASPPRNVSNPVQPGHRAVAYPGPTPMEHYKAPERQPIQKRQVAPASSVSRTSAQAGNAMLVRQAPPASVTYSLFWSVGMFVAVITELAILAIAGLVLRMAAQRDPGGPGMGPGELKFFAFFFVFVVMGGFLAGANSMIRNLYALHYWSRRARAPDASLHVLLQACLWDSSVKQRLAFAIRARAQLEGKKGVDQVSAYLQKIISAAPPLDARESEPQQANTALGSQPCNSASALPPLESQVQPHSVIPEDQPLQPIEVAQARTVPAAKAGEEDRKGRASQASRYKVALACLVILVVVAGLVFAGSWIYHDHVDTGGVVAGKFDEWGISFDPPQGWRRSPKNMESQAVKVLQSGMAGTDRQFRHAALWASPDGGTAFLAGIYCDPSVVSISRLVDDERRKMEIVQRVGDVTKIHEIARKTVGNREVVLSDVERSNGGRGACYYIPSEEDTMCLMLVAKRASDFPSQSRHLDHAVQTLAFGQGFSTVAEPIQKTPSHQPSPGTFKQR